MLMVCGMDRREWEEMMDSVVIAETWMVVEIVTGMVTVALLSVDCNWLMEQLFRERSRERDSFRDEGPRDFDRGGFGGRPPAYDAPPPRDYRPPMDYDRREPPRDYGPDYRYDRPRDRGYDDRRMDRGPRDYPPPAREPMRDYYPPAREPPRGGYPPRDMDFPPRGPPPADDRYDRRGGYPEERGPYYNRR